MAESPRRTERGRRAAAALGLLLALAAGGASAHGGESHDVLAGAAEPGQPVPGPAPDAAPAVGEDTGAPRGAGRPTSGAFATPTPGSYALPPLGRAADGAVLTSDGEAARLHDLFGDRIALLSFIYTRCSDAEGCPFATAVLHRVGARVGREPEVARQLRLLSLSFDPQRDTPEAMRAYGESFRRDGADWRFLTTASEEALAPLLEAYAQTRVPEIDASGEKTGQFAHLLRVFLIDRERRIRQIYSASLLDPEALLADVKTLLLEEAEAAGAAAPGVGGEAAPAPGAGLGPRDPREGYGRPDYTTRSAALDARRGRALDLLARAASPPLGLPPVPVPADNPLSAEKVALGRRLFFDRRLSANDTFSCAMCHVPEQGFASNEMATAVGIEGRTVRRNAPTVLNAAYWERLFHDGRETRLEHQVWGPLLAHDEMGNASPGALLEKLRATDDYAQRFAAAFPDRGLTLETLGMALASYERTLVSGDSPFDRFRQGGDATALSPAAQRGFALFTGEAGCAACHSVGPDTALFTDQRFHNTGVGHARAMQGAPDAGTQRVQGAPDGGGTQRVQVAPGVQLDVPREIVASVSERVPSDLGRYEITRDPADRWRYRTPSLRNVALTAPYMHDGSLATLEDVVEFYRQGGVPNENLDPLVRPLDLSAQDRRDLVAFLESLTGGDVGALVADAFAAPIGDVGSAAPAR